MTRAHKILTFQASAIAAGALIMGVVADMARATPAPTPAAVTIGNFTFNRQALTVKPGTTVTWTNADDIPHTVTSTASVFKSKVLDTGDKFSFTFAKAGQFGYYCSLHPHMTGTVLVKA
jgi:plastocyanin